jgi:hypothetical protein
VPPPAVAALATYLDLVAAWTPRVNLTGAKSDEERVAVLVAPVIGAAGILGPGDSLDVLQLRSGDSVSQFVRSRRPALRSLDVTIVTDVVIRHGFGIDPADPCIEYTNDPDTATSAVRTGNASAAILMRPPSIGQVLAVARSHGRLPQKSTSFVPKVPMGLVMYDFLPFRTDSAHADLR